MGRDHRGLRRRGRELPFSVRRLRPCVKRTKHTTKSKWFEFLEPFRFVDFFLNKKVRFRMRWPGGHFHFRLRLLFLWREHAFSREDWHEDPPRFSSALRRRQLRLQ